MYGWAKLQEETEEQLKIGYSLGRNKSCDGLIMYSKKDGEIEIAKVSDGANEASSEYFICPLRYRIKNGMIISKTYMIMTG